MDEKIMDEKISADQIPCPECDGRGLILKSHEPCECCLGLGLIPILNKIPVANEQKMGAMEVMVRPFSTGSEDVAFCANNCDKCNKSDPQDNAMCDIEAALTVAYWGNGYIPQKIFTRMGGSTGNCSEFQAIPDLIPFTDDEIPFDIEEVSHV